MAINFPNSPLVGQLYEFNDKTWRWSGDYWEVFSAQTGYISGAISSGSGESVYSGQSGSTIVLRSISGGTNTNVTTIGNLLKIDVTSTTGDLQNTLAAGNTTGGNDIIITNGDNIRAINSDPAKTVNIDFGSSVSNRYFDVTTDDGNYITPFLSVTPTLVQLGSNGALLEISDSTNNIDIKTGTFRIKNGSYFSSFITDTLTANRTYTFPNNTGTVAFLSDITTFTGNTSATCISDLYISNLYGCSPITVHDNLQYTGSTASGLFSVAFGDTTVASGNYSFTSGLETSGTSTYATAFGRFSLASGLGSFAKGEATIASGPWSNAKGRGSEASGTASNAEGQDTTASGNNSHAEGSLTTASGLNSHAEGSVTVASGNNSHAQGQQTTASGTYSHAQGFGTTASGLYTHAGGYNVIASGDTSFAHFLSSGATYGVFGNYSAILGGVNNDIKIGATHSSILGGKFNVIDTNVKRSIILGGQSITATTNDTVYAPNINITNNGVFGGGLTATTGLFSSSTDNVLTVIGSGGTNTEPLFNVIGSDGNLLTITDSLFGSIFLVNDVSGLPILEVNATTGATDYFYVNANSEFNGDVSITGNTTIDGDLIVTGVTSASTINITTTPTNNNSLTEILGRNSSTGEIEYRDVSTIGGGGSTGDTFVTAFTYNNLNKLTLGRNAGQSDLDVRIDVMSGLTINGGLTATTGLFSSSTDSVLTIIGSGGTEPLFSVEGSSGELFSITDNLEGSLFSVNDVSGLPIFDVNSDNTILMGNISALSLNTTTKDVISAGSTNLYSIPVSAYTGGFFDYTAVGNGGARSGNIISIWSGTTTQFNEITTNDVGASTSGLSFNVFVSGGSAILSASAVTGTYTIKTIIRGI